MPVWGRWIPAGVTRLGMGPRLFLPRVLDRPSRNRLLRWRVGEGDSRQWGRAPASLFQQAWLCFGSQLTGRQGAG